MDAQPPKKLSAWLNTLSNAGVVLLSLVLALMGVFGGVYVAHQLHKKYQALLERAVVSLAEAHGKSVETLDLVAKLSIETAKDLEALQLTSVSPSAQTVKEVEQRLPSPVPHPKNYRPPQSIAQPPVHQKPKVERNWGILDQKIKAFEQSLFTEPPKE